ncbi:MAG: Trm112 family protein, partial [Armatimonadota bacterium]|nr:Trm112 family protein [Armatimonadota bacterium]
MDGPGYRVDPALLELLACPACHGGLRQEQDRLACARCGRRYPIRDGIPVLLVEEA